MQIISLVLLPLAALMALVLVVRNDAQASVAEGRVLRVKLPKVDSVAALPTVGGAADRPLVVIDAGHGGHDPGASGQGLVEKALVLRLAKSLRDELLREGGVRVALTRDDDRYLVHAERVDIARRLNADLFISIHADSAGDAEDVTGATIYTLSSAASSEAARRFGRRASWSPAPAAFPAGKRSGRARFFPDAGP